MQRNNRSFLCKIVSSLLNTFRTHKNFTQQGPSSETIVVPLVKTCLVFYEAKNYIIVVTITHHWILLYVRQIHSVSQDSICLRSILILSFNLYLGVQSDIFPSGLPTNNFRSFPLSIVCATCPAYLLPLS